MKNMIRVLAFVLIAAGAAPSGLASQVSKNEPPKLHLGLVYIFEADATEFVFVIGNSGFRSVASLKKFIGGLPRGSILEWAPGCVRLGNEPLLSSEEEMNAFRLFCEKRGINFVLIPSG
jgi:hypothetical protein